MDREKSQVRTFKRICLKILYQSKFFLNILSPISFTQPASKNITFRCIFYLYCCLFSVSPILESENSFHSSGINIYILVLLFRYVAIQQQCTLQWKLHHVLLGRRFLQQVTSLSPSPVPKLLVITLTFVQNKKRSFAIFSPISSAESVRV